ncbi:MAG: HEPN domain-containing protein [Bacteroidaceae bacterium]|nr:HEPN domain-containing protein [Bacteroidaceae bacterium]
MTDEQRFDIVTYRLDSAKRLLSEIENHISNGYYNTAMNRMYYACFYAVSALLVHHEIDGVKTHEGVRQQFGQHFVLKGIVSREWGRFYTIMFNSRSAADYEDFKDFDLLTANEQFPKVREFINMIDSLVFSKKG